MSASQEFREFILRGNVVDLAVGVIIGGAFAKIVSAFVADIITPLIGVFAGKIDLSNLHAHVGPVDFAVGDLLNTIITFLIIAAVVFFFVVKPVNYLMSLRKTDTPTEAATRDCPRCLSSVPAAATRCAFCTSDLAAV